MKTIAPNSESTEHTHWRSGSRITNNDNRTNSTETIIPKSNLSDPLPKRLCAVKIRTYNGIIGYDDDDTHDRIYYFIFSISFGLKRFPKTCITSYNGSCARTLCRWMDFAFIHKESPSNFYIEFTLFG